MNRGDLTNEQWEQIAPHLPPEKTKTGRQAREQRQVLNGILWVLRTGTPWRDLPELYGKWTTVYSHFQRLRKDGVWDRVFAGLQAIKEREGQIEWEVHFIDGSVVRAHKHVIGAKKLPRCQSIRKRGIQSTIARCNNE